jgi:putative heme iron utilization protein
MTPETAPESQKSPLRPTTDEARDLARRLISSNRTAALATIDDQGCPFVSLVGCASMDDGSPLLLVSQLSQHTRFMLARPHVSLLFGDTSPKAAKGDPLAHPRLSLSGLVEVIDADDPTRQRARTLYLAQHPKAELYIDFADFLLIRIKPSHAALNGGFGKAYQLTDNDLLLRQPQK